MGHRAATILGPGPNSDFYIGYYDGFSRLESFAADDTDWVFLASFTN